MKTKALTKVSPSAIRSRIPALFAAAGLCLATLPAASHASGWFLPLQYPAGEYHRDYVIGLGVPKLEQESGMHAMKDGTHIFDFKAPSDTGHIYLWDRISSQYNCPVLASTDAHFAKYTTLNRENSTLLKRVYQQLRDQWGDGSTKEQTALLNKLQAAIAKSGRPY